MSVVVTDHDLTLPAEIVGFYHTDRNPLLSERSDVGS